jgi:hypothetical protein
MAALAAARAELLLPSEPGNLESEDPLTKTKFFKQTEIVEAVDVQTGANVRCPMLQRTQETLGALRKWPEQCAKGSGHACRDST